MTDQTRTDRAYDDAFHNMRAKLEELDSLTEGGLAQRHPAKVHYGHVGDLNRIAADLDDILEYVRRQS